MRNGYWRQDPLCTIVPTSGHRKVKAVYKSRKNYIKPLFHLDFAAKFHRVPDDATKSLWQSGILLELEPLCHCFVEGTWTESTRMPLYSDDVETSDRGWSTNAWSWPAMQGCQIPPWVACGGSLDIPHVVGSQVCLEATRLSVVGLHHLRISPGD